MHTVHAAFSFLLSVSPFLPFSFSFFFYADGWLVGRSVGERKIGSFGGLCTGTKVVCALFMRRAERGRRMDLDNRRIVVIFRIEEVEKNFET